MIRAAPVRVDGAVAALWSTILQRYRSRWRWWSRRWWEARCQRLFAEERARVCVDTKVKPDRRSPEQDDPLLGALRAEVRVDARCVAV